MESRLDELIASISRAFAAIPFPGDENIIAGDSLHFATCDECREVRGFFRGKTRESCAKDENGYRQTVNAFSLFTPAAWQYYLPVYLIGCLQKQRLRYEDFWYHEESIVRDKVWPLRVKQLTPYQCSVIVDYLSYAHQQTIPHPDRTEDCLRVLNWWKEIYQNISVDCTLT